jgi:phospholipase/carboxylesterase
MSLAYELRPAAGDAAGALVLLHGRGADEQDLFGLVELLDPQRRLTAMTPGGPLHLPPGGRHWYVVPRVGFPDPTTFRESLELLDEVPEITGVPWERTVIGGFSQGAVMSFALGLGAGRPTPAGIINMSGFIPVVPGWEPDLERPQLPVWIAHGRRDPVIPVDFAREARRRLDEAGIPVTYHEHDGGHQVDPRLIAELPAWIDDAIGSAVTRESA